MPRIAAVVLILLVGGAVVPHLLARGLPAPAGGAADAIFVLAGGENRIAVGYRAWKEGIGRQLYILGARRKVRPEQLLPGHPALGPAGLEKIHVEGWSENTLENAFSAKSVVTAQRFRSVVLVTSDYHLPRAYLALRKFLPQEVSLTAIPVASEWHGVRSALRSLRLFFLEGWKYWVYRVFLHWE
ncbi:MAG: YdcF family protein [Deltaproteobacteria bacterium]|nr:YdcF family protein [Deltaproteobacteria bacterium]